MISNVICRLLFTALLCSVAACQSALASDMDTGTLTLGPYNGENCPIPHSTGTLQYTGYAFNMGSYSPTGLTGGTTVEEIENTISTGSCATYYPEQAQLAISGFSSNPGTSWLISIKCNGASLSGSSATFVYSDGAASWTWSGSLFSFEAAGTPTSCTITHN
jgi:hypothetical protein